MDKKATGLFLALSLSIIACLPLLVGDGPINTRGGGDSPFLLVRLHQLVSNLSAGVFPARWMPDAAYGLGYPFFNFYASLPYYIAALFKLGGFGFIWAIKLTQLLGFVAAAASMYLLAKRLFKREASAILAALAYTYAPYHLVNVYVRGDALSEFYAFVFYPLILWALLRLRDSLSVNEVSPQTDPFKNLVPQARNGMLRSAQHDK
jgi:4-amino-4-deoxy-L-arabinose transferase-like glycosyltransferase